MLGLPDFSATPENAMPNLRQSFVVGGVPVKTVVLGPTCWPYLYQNTPFVSGGLIPPPYEKMRSN